ncbi:MAG: CDP-glycerol glycerophosphotransferase family protein [Actinomycetia bacterium]|nr:CDP-glycerol glycerophosphotransferase family protein [Actinomycetes bacterium]
MREGTVGDGPLFSLIVAVCDVERYLPDFIASVDRQRFDLRRVEVIAVDDGSTDGSLRLLRAWQARRPGLVQVLTKENGGQASARNLALPLARGRWVGFPDPDDVLAGDYLAKTAKALAACPGGPPDIVHVPMLMWDEARGVRSDTHPRRERFRHRGVVDLVDHPECFPGSASAAFLPRAALAGLTFNERLRPNFEDGDFCARHLLNHARPRVLHVNGTWYHYRKRADLSSSLQTQALDPRRFLVVPREGYLALLTDAERLHGRPPTWLQDLILYEIGGFLRADQRVSESASAAQGEVGAAFLATLGEIAGHLEPSAIETFPVYPWPAEWRDLLMYAAPGLDHVTPYVWRDHVDRGTGEVRLRLRYCGSRQPTVVLGDDQGRPLDVRARKVRSIVYFGQPAMHELIWWVRPGAGLRVRRDGTDWPVRDREPERGRDRAPRSAALLGSLRRTSGKVLRKRPGLRALAGMARALAVGVASAPYVRLPWVRARYAGAWTFMDWLSDANDNGEMLFRHVREHRLDLNAWFVLQKDTPDWAGLARDHGDRLVPLGSLAWAGLRRLNETFVTSQLTRDITEPPGLRHLGVAAPRLVFLQHGVIRDDISRWLNTKPIDLCLASTPAEAASLTDDGTPYVLSTRDVALTGLPRFDRLWRLGQAYPPGRRDLVVIAPTWRASLVTRGDGVGRHEPLDDFAGSPFARAWLALLRDDRLAVALREAGVRIGLLPHPNLKAAWAGVDLPHVEVLDFVGENAGLAFARAAVFVTDYSSMAFSSAYLGRPVVYYQFDRDDYFRGGNVSRPGYFDFARDGFGPVVTSAEIAVDAILGLLAETPQVYAERMDRAFAWRDGHNCERALAAIERGTRPDTENSSSLEGDEESSCARERS